MDHGDATQALGMFSETWQKAVDARDWHAAISTGIAAYIFFAAQNNEQFKGGATGLIIAALKLQDPEDGLIKHRCSFCNKHESEIRLGAGPSAFICENCVQMFSDIFSKRDKDS